MSSIRRRRTAPSAWILLLLALLATTTRAQRCGCQDCTEAVLATDAKGRTCGQRIDDRLAIFPNETLACTFVAEYYPLACGPMCHPRKCDGQAPALCQCPTCTADVWNSDADGFTCGERILLMLPSMGETAACRSVAERFPDTCGPCHATECPAESHSGTPTTAATTSGPTPPPPPRHCSCRDCTPTVLDTVVDGYTCGERIAYLQNTAGLSEDASCDYVANRFAPCAGCGTTSKCAAGGRSVVCS